MKRPIPSKQDLLDAVTHADLSTGEDGLKLSDFELRWLGNLTVPQLREYDDIDAWVGLDERSTEEDLFDFRGKKWAERALEWVRTKKLPPIVVITSFVQPGLFERNFSSHTQIGDGRGRVSIANMFGLKVPTWELVQKLG